MRSSRHHLHHYGRTLFAAILAFVVISALVFLLLRGGSTTGDRQPEPVVAQAPTTMPVAVIDPAEIVPGRQIGPITLGMTQEEVREALGEPDSRLNKMWSWTDPQMSVGFGPDSEVVVILAGGVGVTPRRVPFRSPEGIAIGATPDQVIAAWGQPDADRTDKAPLGVSRQMNYTGRGIQLLFYDGDLVWLSVRDPPAVTTQPAP